MARQCQRWIIAIDYFRHWKKLEEVQSSFFGDTICSSGDGIGSRLQENCGCSSRNFSDWFLESISAELFKTPGMCDAMMVILNKAWKNHKHLSRCITIVSFKAPLFMASTRLRLSYWNSMHVHANEGPQIAQLNTIGTSSFTIMFTSFHSADQAYCSHRWLKHAPHPQWPDASVWIW